jgi:hypothetical protein
MRGSDIETIAVLEEEDIAYLLPGKCQTKCQIDTSHGNTSKQALH